MPPHRPIVAIDLGGTKIAAARVRGGAVEARREAPTPSAEGPEAVARIAAELVAPWLDAEGGARLAVAATGHVHDGRVTALNEGTMPGWDAFPLAERLREATGAEPVVLNDAHAATWGEYRHGAGVGLRDFAFVTLSTGLGGGFVADGRLVRGTRGLAGHLGFWRDTDPAARGVPYLERRASGRALGEAGSARLGRPVDARAVLGAAAAGDEAAEALLDEVVHRVATALLNLQLLADLERIAIGGGLGLAPGVLARLRAAVDAWHAFHPPVLVPARLGSDAGLIGAAAYAFEAAGG